MEPSLPTCDTKSQILIFAINFATRGKKMNKHKHSIPLECHSDNPLKMIPNKKNLKIQKYKKSSSIGTHNHNYKN